MSHDPKLPAQGHELLYRTGNPRKLQAQHAKRLKLILGRQHALDAPQDAGLWGRDHP